MIEMTMPEFTPTQVRSYEDSLKYYRDLKKSLDTARYVGKIEIVKKALNKGIICIRYY